MIGGFRIDRFKIISDFGKSFPAKIRIMTIAAGPHMICNIIPQKQAYE